MYTACLSCYNIYDLRFMARLMTVFAINEDAAKKVQGTAVEEPPGGLSFASFNLYIWIPNRVHLFGKPRKSASKFNGPAPVTNWWRRNSIFSPKSSGVVFSMQSTTNLISTSNQQKVNVSVADNKKFPMSLLLDPLLEFAPNSETAILLIL